MGVQVSVDVRAPFSGVLEAQLAKIDDNVLVGSPLFSVVKQEGGGASAVSSAGSATEEPAAAEQAAAPAAASSGAEALETVNVPSMGDSISEGTVVGILKSKRLFAL